jgi:hypothetical protein
MITQTVLICLSIPRTVILLMRSQHFSTQLLEQNLQKNWLCQNKFKEGQLQK